VPRGRILNAPVRPFIAYPEDTIIGIVLVSIIAYRERWQPSLPFFKCARQGQSAHKYGRRRSAETSMDEGDAQRKAERPQDSRKVVPTNRDKNTARERQSSAAAEENAQPEATKC